jgi:hypothetical protein
VNRISAGKSSFGDYLRISGSEYITTVEVPTRSLYNSPGSILFSRPNGSAPPNTRLAQFAEIYERWHPRVYTYRFIPSQPTTTPGTYIMAQEADCAAVYPVADATNVPRFRVMPGSVMAQMWEPASCHISKSGDYTSLWCNDPNVGETDVADRLDLAGVFYFAYVVGSGLASGTALGIIELDYEIDFYVPRLSGPVMTHTTEFTKEAPISTGEYKYFDSSAPDATVVTHAVDRAVNLFKAASGVAPTLVAAVNGIQTALKLYKSPPSFSPMENFDSAYGWPPGVYTGAISFYTDTAPNTVSNPTKTWLGLSGGTTSGLQYSIRSDLIPYSSTLLGPVYDPNDTAWDWGEGFDFEFEVSGGGSAGYADWALVNNDSANPIPADMQVFFTFRTAGAPRVLVIEGKGVSVARKADRPHRLESPVESKEELKEVRNLSGSAATMTDLGGGATFTVLPPRPETGTPRSLTILRDLRPPGISSIPGGPASSAGRPRS